jgi:hypothetical protein
MQAGFDGFLQSTFDRITGQVVGRVPSTGIQQELRVSDPLVGQSSGFLPVH